MDFLENGKDEVIPCWRGAGAAYECLEQVRSARGGGWEL
jgi:hypothetical protein